MFIGQTNKVLIRLVVDYGAIGNPSDLILVCLDPEKATCMFENFERLASVYFADMVRYWRDAVAQVHLPRPDVHRFMLLVVDLATTCRKRKKAKAKGGKSPGS